MIPCKFLIFKVLLWKIVHEIKLTKLQNLIQFIVQCAMQLYNHMSKFTQDICIGWNSTRTGTIFNWIKAKNRTIASNRAIVNRTLNWKFTKLIRLWCWKVVFGEISLVKMLVKQFNHCFVKGFVDGDHKWLGYLCETVLTIWSLLRMDQIKSSCNLT